MWNRSPEAYQEQSENGMLRLPSGRLLQYYNNSVQQKPGLNEEVLQWMEQEADKVKLTELGRCGAKLHRYKKQQIILSGKDCVKN